MKVPIGNTGTHLEIGQYRAVDKGALKGFFTIVEYPTGRKTMDCRFFIKGNQKWFGFPQKENKKPGAEKPEYIPLVSIINQEYKQQYTDAVLKALEEFDDQSNSTKGQEAPLQDEPPSLWF